MQEPEGKQNLPFPVTDQPEPVDMVAFDMSCRSLREPKTGLGQMDGHLTSVQ